MLLEALRRPAVPESSCCSSRMLRCVRAVDRGTLRAAELAQRRLEAASHCDHRAVCERVEGPFDTSRYRRAVLAVEGRSHELRRQSGVVDPEDSVTVAGPELGQ